MFGIGGVDLVKAVIMDYTPKTNQLLIPNNLLQNIDFNAHCIARTAKDNSKIGAWGDTNWDFDGLKGWAE